MKEDEGKAILEVIADQFKCSPSKIQPETSFEELSADSLGMVELVTALENSLHISIPDAEAGKMKTVGELVRIVQGTH